MADRPGHDVGGKQHERDRHDPPCALLSLIGIDARPGEAPDDDQGGGGLDGAVEPPPDEGHRVGHEPGGQADGSVNAQPREGKPGDQLDATDERGLLREWCMCAGSHGTIVFRDAYNIKGS